VDFRSRENAAMLLDSDHKKRGEHTWEIKEYVENPKHVPTPEELIQKP
jgi:hypothetical protein